MAGSALELFSPAARNWFQAAFGSPTEVQKRGWPAVASGRHTLMTAPTGSGKTLAAFLWCLDRVAVQDGGQVAPGERCRVLYVSPLKALAVDVERNLRAPLVGLRLHSERLGLPVPDIQVAIRSGDTPAGDRRSLERRPPDVLITTPESLYLILTSAARRLLASVRWVIVDEIHSVAATKRGAHLAISLERLSSLTSSDPQRIGLSATQRPLEEVARFLGGAGREVAIVDAGRRKTLQVRVEVPVEDMADLDRGVLGGVPPPDRGALGGVPPPDRGALGGVPPSDRGALGGVPPPDRGALGGVPPSDKAAPAGAATTQGGPRGADAPLPEGAGGTDGPLRDGRGAGGGPAAAYAGELPQPRRSIWPAIYPRLLELVQQHRSTIVFVNSRRLAERLAARLNEAAGEELVLAHHGSIAREQRTLVEDRLKAGLLRGLVATSSLELGIDMGAVDLVIQVESPPSVATGIQRIGRAGHSVGEVSRGTVFPKFRGDLLESAAVVEGMLQGEIESTVVPENPLDVLAQQLVAITALEEWSADEVYGLLRRAHPFRQLGRRSFEAVLDMLSGRYPSEEFAELRPRVVWDRLRGTVRGRAGAQRLAVTNPGTIPDRGLYTVNIFGDGRKVGELDEEMVFESRPGEHIVLGASTWKIVDITPSQVLVQPAPGQPGKVAFWHGDSLSRPAELGRALGRLTRELRSLEPEAAERRLMERAGFDERAASNLLAYLRDQAQATGAVPDDRTVVVERFRDEIGDWRVCVLTPFGGRVHAPWALALQARLTESLGIEVQSMYTDDGLALRLPDADRPLDVEALTLDPEDVNDLVSSHLPGSALFASRFRENAARALLLPRRRPGQRTPLWQQRQRSADLLKVASGYPDFPILAETYRECLVDVFDLGTLRGLLSDIRSRAVRVVAVDTDRASPFAASLLFDYVGQFIYEGDAPLAERRAQALTLDRQLLAELLGSEELRELLDPAAVAEVEIELQGLGRERWPRDRDEAHDVLARLGDLTAEELAARGVRQEWLEALRQERRALMIRAGAGPRWIASEDAARYRDALGASLPAGLPDAFLARTPEPLDWLLRRWARTHVPFAAADVAGRWGLAPGTVESALRRLVDRGDLLAGQFGRGDGAAAPGSEYCHPEVLRRLRRRSLAALRREAEAVPAEVLARFLPAWHGVGAAGSQGTGLGAGGLAPTMDRLLEVIFTLQGLALPASIIERDVLRGRIPGYRPAQLDELISMGEVVWVGRGALGSGDGRVALYLRQDAPNLVPEPAPADRDALHRALLAHLERRGASFFRELYAAAGGGDQDAVLDALWDLVWNGKVTNDTFGPLRLLGPAPRRRGPARRPVLPRLSPPRAAGRWSLVADLGGAVAPSPTERLYAEAGALLQRHGVLTREAVLAEGWSGGFAALYPVLRTMEEAGKIRRGYFVDGLGGSQFALPGAVDRLRGARDPNGVLALAAADPAQPYGAVLPWPTPADAEQTGRMARTAGAYVVLEDGELRLYLERGGRSLLTRGEVGAEHLRALVAVATRVGKVELRLVDGLPTRQSGLAPLLAEAGFGPTPRGMVAWPKTA